MLTDEDKHWISEQISEQLLASEVRMAERLERVETKLLTEFHKWASPVEMRQRSNSYALSAIDLEVEALRDRVKKLEGGA
jgi:hypothetical protein